MPDPPLSGGVIPPAWRETGDSDKSKRFSDDEVIRGAGFKLVSRPRPGEAVWELGGRRYGQAEALNVALRKVEKSKGS